MSTCINQTNPNSIVSNLALTSVNANNPIKLTRTHDPVEIELTNTLPNLQKNGYMPTQEQAMPTDLKQLAQVVTKLASQERSEGNKNLIKQHVEQHGLRECKYKIDWAAAAKKATSIKTEAWINAISQGVQLVNHVAGLAINLKKAKTQVKSRETNLGNTQLQISGYTDKAQTDVKTMAKQLKSPTSTKAFTEDEKKTSCYKAAEASNNSHELKEKHTQAVKSKVTKLADLETKYKTSDNDLKNDLQKLKEEKTNLDNSIYSRKVKSSLDKTDLKTSSLTYTKGKAALRTTRQDLDKQKSTINNLKNETEALKLAGPGDEYATQKAIKQKNRKIFSYDQQKVLSHEVVKAERREAWYEFSNSAAQSAAKGAESWLTGDVQQKRVKDDAYANEQSSRIDTLQSLEESVSRDIERKIGEVSSGQQLANMLGNIG